MIVSFLHSQLQQKRVVKDLANFWNILRCALSLVLNTNHNIYWKFFSKLRKMSLLTLGSLKLSSNEFQANGPAIRKPVGCVCVAEEPGVVDWRIWDAAEKRCQRLACRGRPNTAAIDLAGNCMCTMTQSLNVVDKVYFLTWKRTCTQWRWWARGPDPSLNLWHLCKSVSFIGEGRGTTDSP